MLSKSFDWVSYWLLTQRHVHADTSAVCSSAIFRPGCSSLPASSMPCIQPDEDSHSDKAVCSGDC